MFEQLEFDFAELKIKKEKRKKIDYESLYQRLLQGPVTFREIQNLTGVSKTSVMNVIDVLSVRYPVWEPERGVYKLLEESDYD